MANITFRNINYQSIFTYHIDTGSEDDDPTPSAIRWYEFDIFRFLCWQFRWFLAVLRAIHLNRIDGF